MEVYSLRSNCFDYECGIYSLTVRGDAELITELMKTVCKSDYAQKTGLELIPLTIDNNQRKAEYLEKKIEKEIKKHDIRL